MTVFKAGLIGIIAIAVFTYLGFTKFANPFASPFTIHATFANANQLRPGSLVRIAGINVGMVQSVNPVSGCKVDGHEQHQCSAADVTMTVQDQGLPLHKDATFWIRPRIFLEGNFFVDVSPGTPEAPLAPDNYTFPVQQGREPVQVDQVLSSLQADTRQNLQILLQQYGSAVKQSGSSYNASVHYWLPAYKYSSIVAHDFLGIKPHDLSNWIDKMGIVSGALDSNPPDLKSLITDFNTTANAFARERTALEQTVAQLPKTLSSAMPALTAVNNALCGPPFCATRSPFRQLALALVPGTISSSPTITASLPFISQLRQLVQPSELRGLTADLAVTVPALAKLTVETIPFMRNGVRPASSCVANVIHPWSQLTLHDSHFNASNGFPPRKVYVEAVDFLPGLAGESRNFDANGMYIRILGALGNTVTTSLTPGLYGGALQPLLGSEPQLPPGGHRPPIAGGDIPNYPCETQPPITDLTASTGPAPAPITAGPPPPLASKRAQAARVALMAQTIHDLNKQGTPVRPSGQMSALLKSFPRAAKLGAKLG